MLRFEVKIADSVRHFELPRNVAGALTIGSAADNDFVIVCPGVSRRHATLERVDDRILLKDAGSKNGIVVRGRRQNQVQLAPGDAVLLGRARVVLEEVSTSDVMPGVVFAARSTSHVGDLPYTTASASESTGAAAALRWARAAETVQAMDASERRRLLDEALAIAGADALTLFTDDAGEAVVREVFGAVSTTEKLDDDPQWTRIKLQTDDFVAVHRLHPSRFHAWEREFLEHVAEKLFASSRGRKPAAIPASEIVFPEKMVLGHSPAMISIRERLQMAIQSDLPVLVRGETGTGKELVAQTIHQSSRAKRPFRAPNCAAFNADLLEAELFGIRKGVATGVEMRAGLFVEAAGGTILLDEIGDMPAALQAKLLRVLQEREVVPVGGSAPVKINVRIIASTHRDLEVMIRDGSFRSDLYHRLRGIEIVLPPLRTRREDIPELLTAFVERIAQRIGKRIRGVSRKALALATSYAWPGNVRELQTAVERAVLACPQGGIIQAAHFDLPHQSLPTPPSADALHERIEALERDTILDALQKCKGNKSRAAKMLGITRGGLYLKMRRFGIE